MFKRICLTGVIILLISLSIQSSFAETGNPSITQTENPSIQLNGTHLDLKASVQEGQIYLPARAISELLGFEVSWSQEDKTVSINGKDKMISINLKNMTEAVNQHESYLSYSPDIIGGRTYMRDDFYAENFSLKVQWDKENNVVTLVSLIENPIMINTVQLNMETKALKTTVKYPQIEGLADENIQNDINAIFKKHADNALLEGAKNATDLAPAVLEFPDMPGQCETYVDYQIKYNQNNILSLVLINYEYAGGAHGSTVQTAYTFDLKTGQQFALKDLFKSGTDFTSILNNSIKAQLDERDLTSALFEPFKGINENQNYFLSNKGLVVYFNQYEILPYAAGMPEFTVYYSLLSNLLKAPEIIKENLSPGAIESTFLHSIMNLAKQGKVINGIYPVDTTVIKSGDYFILNLKGNPTTGFMWHYVIENSDIIQPVAESVVPDSGLIGAGSTFIWEFKALKTGNSKITLKYYRSWEGEASVLPENIVTYNFSIK